MISILYTRNIGWNRYNTKTDIDIRYVPVAGTLARNKKGVLSGDGQFTKATEKGKELLYVEMAKKPDVFVWWPHLNFNLQEVRTLRNISKKTLFMLVDGNQPHDVNHYAVNFKGLFNIMLINTRDPGASLRYRKYGYKVDTLYDGFHPYEHIPFGNPTYDCFFGGSNLVNHRLETPGSKFRLQLMVSINRYFNLLLYGSMTQWGKYGFNCKGLHWPHYFPAMQKAKILLGANQYDLPRYYTRRFIHSGSSGRMFMTKYIPDMEEDFTNHKDIVWFNNIQEALELIEYYLKHGNEREKVAEYQREKFLKCHTWNNRLLEVRQIVEKCI